MTRLIPVIALLAGVAVAHSQEFATSYQSTEVSPGIHMIEGVGGFGGGNVGLLVGDEHVVMIDDTMVPTAPAVIAVAAEAASGREIDFVINTHVHGDHAGGNALLAEAGAVVVAHENIRKRLLDDPAAAGGVGGIPVITFDDGMTFHVNGHEAHVFHVEHAHTDGDAVIHFRNANVIHTGDVMFNGMFPFIDLDGGGSVGGFIAAARRIHKVSNDETRIIPGHGPLASKADLAAFIDMLVDAQARVKELALKGMTLEEVVAENPLSMYHDEWNWEFITTEIMTQTLYRSLTSE